MAQWEYLTTFVEAKASDKTVKTYIQQTFDKKAKKHSPESMIPALNAYGAEGWELLHMEPVPRVGRKEDVQFDPHSWSSTYFCVFKRQKAGSPTPTGLGQQKQQSAPETTPAAPQPDETTPDSN